MSEVAAAIVSNGLLLRSPKIRIHLCIYPQSCDISPINSVLRCDCGVDEREEIVCDEIQNSAFITRNIKTIFLFATY